MPATVSRAPGSVSTGPLTTLGTYSVQLMCTAAAGNSITASRKRRECHCAGIDCCDAAGAAGSAAGGTTQLTATGTYTDGSTKDLTSTATWVSSAPARGHGLGGLGELQHQCSRRRIRDDFSDRRHRNRHHHRFDDGHLPGPGASAPSRSHPRSSYFQRGAPGNCQPTGNYSSGPAQTVTNTVQWSSSVSSVATVSATGLVTCNAGLTTDGSSTITATSGSVSASISVTCQAPH